MPNLSEETNQSFVNYGEWKKGIIMACMNGPWKGKNRKKNERKRGIRVMIISIIKPQKKINKINGIVTE